MLDATVLFPLPRKPTQRIKRFSTSHPPLRIDISESLARARNANADFHKPLRAKDADEDQRRDPANNKPPPTQATLFPLRIQRAVRMANLVRVAHGFLPLRRSLKSCSC